jgi:hypothetical protein
MSGASPQAFRNIVRSAVASRRPRRNRRRPRPRGPPGARGGDASTASRMRHQKRVPSDRGRASGTPAPRRVVKATDAHQHVVVLAHSGGAHPWYH